MKGKVVQQSDVIQWRAMAQQSFEFKEKYGHFPKWTNSMMGGMPAYQIAVGPKEPIHIHLQYVQNILTLGISQTSILFIYSSACVFTCFVL